MQKKKTRFAAGPVYMDGLGIAQYICIGDGLKFLPQLSFYRGIRLVLEQVAMRCRSRGPGQINSGDSGIGQAIKIIESAFSKEGNGIRSGLFLRTHWYKATVMIGCADIGGVTRFIKVYKRESDAVQEAERTELLSGLYGRWFDVPKVETRSGPLLVLSYLPRRRWASGKEASRRISAAARSWQQNDDLKMVPIETLIKGLGSSSPTFRRAGIPEPNVKRLLHDLENNLPFLGKQYPIHLSHGDMTPWNMHVTGSGKMALVDSERVCERVLHTDLLHFVVQKQAFARFSVASPGYFIRFLSKSACIEESEAMRLLVLYLSEELIIDATEMDISPIHKTLQRALCRKFNWMTKIIEKIQDSGLIATD